jgi:hypothetical protein
LLFSWKKDILSILVHLRFFSLSLFSRNLIVIFFDVAFFRFAVYSFTQLLEYIGECPQPNLWSLWLITSLNNFSPTLCFFFFF